MKKMLAVFAAGLLVMASSVTAFASSPTTNTTPAPATQQATVAVAQTQTPDAYVAATQTATAGVTVAATSQTYVDSAAAEVKNLLADVKALGTALGNQSLVSAADTKGANVTATVLSVVDLSNTSAVANANGTYTVTLSVANISAGDTVMVLHYVGSGWETIVPSVANGAITFDTASFSPFAVVKVAVGSKAGAPKTGENLPMGVMILALGLCAAAVSSKKFFA